jgi:serine/threonine protein kinase
MAAMSNTCIPISNKSKSVPAFVTPAALNTSPRLIHVSLNQVPNPEFYTTLTRMIPENANPFQIEELTLIITEIATKLSENGFKDLKFKTKQHQYVFTAMKDEQMFKIKIMSGRSFKEAMSYLNPADRTRGEYCVLDRFAEYSQIVKLHSEFGSELYRARVFKYIDGKTLWKLICQSKYPQDLPLVLGYVLQYVQLIQIMHSKGVAHRDIKSDNAIVNRNGQVFATDHDTARYGSEEEMAYSPRGTTNCCALERLCSVVTSTITPPQGYSLFPEDRWSLGVLIYEACIRAYFAYKVHYAGAMIQYLEEEWPKEQLQLEENFQKKGIPQNTADQLAKLVRSLMHVDPKERMKLDEVAQTLQSILRDLEEQIKIDAEKQTSEPSTGVSAS